MKGDSKGSHSYSKETFAQKFKRFMFIDKEMYPKERTFEPEKKAFNNSIHSVPPMPKRHSIKKRSFFAIIVVFLCIIIAIGIFFTGYLQKAYSSYENGFDTNRIDIESVPHIYDNDGNLLMVMYGYYDTGKDDFVPTYSSSYVSTSDIPNFVSDAFLAIEDHTFYDNNGISLNRLLYAMFNYMAKGDSSFGGSTITQQLVKVATGDDSHSPDRKAREIGSALYLTDHWTKAKILGSYINLVYYGEGAYGIYEASLTYFGVTPDKLNLAQAATLASLPNSPENLNPYKNEANLARLMNRKKLVLQKMLELSLITEEQYNEAKDFNIEFTNSSSQMVKNDPAMKQYIDIAFKETIQIVMSKYSCSKTEAITKILDGNTKIYLNMDRNLQKKSYEVATTHYGEHGDFEIGYILTNKSGQVLSIVGSINNSQVDHVYEMTRQTGSAIKPITVYSPAYDLGILNPNSYVNDVAVSIKSSSGTWNVKNASRTYMGTITATQAVAYSLNTVAVTTLEKVSLSKSMEYAKSFGITSLTSDDMYYPALGLGGFSHGVSPYEMAQAYNVFNNDGVFKSISTVNKIDISGNTIRKETNEHRVISSEAAEMMKTSMLASGIYGTGKSAKLSGIDTYLKTGTTSDNKDFWTCGFTNDVTAIIWGGYDIPREISYNYGVKVIWKELVQAYYSTK